MEGEDGMETENMVNDLFGDSDILVLGRRPSDEAMPARAYQKLVLVISKNDAELCVEGSYSGENAISMRRWHGFEKAYTIASSSNGMLVISKSRLIDFIDSVAVDIDALASGFEDDRYDGQHYVPVLTYEGASAAERLEYSVGFHDVSSLTDDTWTAYSAATWLRTMSVESILASACINVESSDMEISNAAAGIVAEAKSDYIILDKEDVEKELHDVIDEVNTNRLNNDCLG